MRFGSPHYFWLLIAIPAVIAFFIWAYQRRQDALRRFAQAELIKRLTPSADFSRQAVKWAIFIVFLFFLILALVRPRFGVQLEMIERKGVDIIVALDVSQSMLAQDITPSRLDRAKHEIGKFISLLKGDRIGLIVFAGESFIQCPLTLDYAAASLFLDVVNTDWIQMQGTAVGDAINQAAKSFHSTSRKHKVLVVISDGEDHEGDPVAAAHEAAKDGVKIYTIGIGSEGGVPIPLNAGGGNVVYKKDNAGNLVLTKLNPAILEKIALEGNGSYFNAGTDLDLAKIYDEISRMEKKDLGTNRMAIYEERYQLFLLIALLFLLLEFFIPDRVKKKEEWKGRFK